MCYRYGTSIKTSLKTVPLWRSLVLGGPQWLQDWHDLCLVEAIVTLGMWCYVELLYTHSRLDIMFKYNVFCRTDATVIQWNWISLGVLWQIYCTFKPSQSGPHQWHAKASAGQWMSSSDQKYLIILRRFKQVLLNVFIPIINHWYSSVTGVSPALNNLSASIL